MTCPDCGKSYTDMRPRQQNDLCSECLDRRTREQTAVETGITEADIPY